VTGPANPLPGIVRVTTTTFLEPALPGVPCWAWTLCDPREVFCERELPQR